MHREGRGYGNLGHAYQSHDDYGKAIEYHEKCLKIAIEIGDQARDGKPIEVLEMLTSHWVTMEKLLSIMKKV